MKYTVTIDTCAGDLFGTAIPEETEGGLPVLLILGDWKWEGRI